MNYITKTLRKESVYGFVSNQLNLIMYILMSSLSIATAQTPAIQWENTYMGNSSDYVKSMKQNADGGFILGSYSNSGIGGDKSQFSKGVGDYWLIKTDALGNKLWDKTIGGNSLDVIASILNTTDGGYLVGGYSSSAISGDKSEASRGSYDYWIVKLDASGNKIWDKTYGGSLFDNLTTMDKTMDGGYILGGYSNSGIGGEKSQINKGLNDYWILRINGSGAILWEKSFGGSGEENLESVIQTTDGGFLLGGHSASGISGDKTEMNKGGGDYWIIKLDSSGNMLWDRTIGGNGSDRLYSIAQLPDGNCILGGQSLSNAGGDKSQNSKGSSDFWIVKVDGSGNKIWDKTIGGTSSEFFAAMDLTSDNGIILGGYSISNSGLDKSENNKGVEDYWVVKLDAAGNKIWDKTVGGSSYDFLFTLVQCSDGGYALGGRSHSNADGDKSENSSGGLDGWVIKLAPESLITDTIPPDIASLPDTVYANNDPGFCSAQVSWLDPEVTDSGGVALIQSDYSSGDTFPVGATTVTYTAQDSSGNTAMASFVIVVTDNEAPVVATQNITIYLNDSGYAMITPMDIDFGSTDNCGIASFQLNNSYFDINSPDYDSVYLMVTDIHGNQASLGAIVTVVKPDTIPPVILIINDTIFAAADPGMCSARVNWVEPEIFDESGYGISQSDFHPGDSFQVGSWTVTYTAFDSSGNMSTASFVIIVSDQEAPVVLTKEVTIYLNDSGYAEITAMDIENGSTDNCGIAGFRLSQYRFDCSSPGQDSVQLTVTDIYGNEASAGAAVIVVDNLSPEWVTSSGSLDRQIYCGDSAGLAEAQGLSPVATDNCGMVTLFKTVGNLMENTYTNTWLGLDPSGNPGELFTQVIALINLSVDASASSNPVELGTAALLSAQVYPVIAGIEVNFYLDEILAGTALTNGSGSAQLSVAGLPAGVYKIRALLGGGCAESIAYLPVYDPDGGFVTGGGWIQSPAGAYPADPSLNGKANFGFVSKYKKGNNEVDGNTEFQLKAGNLNFKSSSHTAASLVIAGAKAIYKGIGTVNGSGSYGFMVSAIDGQVNGGGNADKFRIKIWDKNNGNGVIYDNQLGADENADATTLLGGGSIVIHKPKNGQNLGYSTQGTGLKINASHSIKLEAYPNPMQNRLNLRIDNPENHPVKIDLIHITGRLMPVKVREVSNQFYQLDVTDLPVGVYSLQVQAGRSVQHVKVLKQE